MSVREKMAFKILQQIENGEEISGDSKITRLSLVLDEKLKGLDAILEADSDDIQLRYEGPLEATEFRRIVLKSCFISEYKKIHASTLDIQDESLKTINEYIDFILVELNLALKLVNLPLSPVNSQFPTVLMLPFLIRLFRLLPGSNIHRTFSLTNVFVSISPTLLLLPNLSLIPFLL